MTRGRLWCVVFFTAFAVLSTSQAGPIGGSIDVTPATHYLWRGADLLGGAKVPVQPSVTLSHESGFSASLWASYALMDRDSTQYADEWDFTLAYTRDVAQGIGMSVGGIYYRYPNASQARTSELYLGASLSNVILSPAVTVYYDTEWFDEDSVKADGWYVVGKIAHSVPVSSLSLDLSAGLGVASNDTFHGLQDLSFTAWTSLPVGPITVSPYVITTFVFQDAVNSDDIVYCAGVTLHYPF